MREQSIDAGLRRWRIEDELRLPVLLEHSVVVTHHDRAIGIPTGSQANPKDSEVHAKGQNSGCRTNENRPENDPPDPLPKLLDRELTHEARL